MGNYNPDAPFILGNEFAGIKDFDLEFSYNNNAAEYGVGFTLPGSTTLTDARVYSHPYDPANNILSPNQAANTPLLVSVYPAGKQYDSGPIRRVIIPVTGGQVTGSGSTSSAGNVVYNGGTVNVPGTPPTNAQVANAVFDDGTGLQMLTPPSDASPFGSYQANLWFGTDQYAQLLQGKRILEINIIFKVNSATGVDAFSTQDSCNLAIGVVIGNLQGFGTGLNSNASTAAFLFGDNNNQIQRFKVGEATNMWLIGSSVQNEIVPWTPTLLQNWNLNATQATRFGIRFYRQSGNAAGAFAANSNRTYFVSSVAMEVIYCEETRVAYGGRSSVGHWPYGATPVPMRTPGTLATGPTLPAGDYFVTVTNGSFLGFNTATTAQRYPPLNALQTYYDLPAHRPIMINRPFPIINGVGQQLTAGDPPAVPQITLHDNTGAVIQASHVYGRRADVTVDTATSPVQVLETSNIVPGARYDQVRFYARRWGTADQALTLSVQSATASITAAQLDALPEIVDGYREVTLPLSQAVTVTGSGVDISATFSSPNSVGRQWEVLGVIAPALSGVFGNDPESYLYQLPAAAQLGVATYLQGTGATDALSWLSYAPPVSGTTLDPQTDAVLMLAQSPIQVSGVALSQASLALTGAALNCGVTPREIPSAITYHSLTWNNPGITGSGFSYYEIQRSDAYDSTWQTIAKLPTEATTSFRDYEARVGVLTSYRIRVVNALGFAGIFSATVSGTIAAPGVTLGSADKSGVLLFTSNTNQAGVYTLAYIEALSTTPTEAVTFPESGRLKLQWMYGHDDQTAFYPTERGGEQFTRTILVNNAGVTGPVVQRGFQSLRDMAWAGLPYVCVRNEIGDRWYANVSVPSGTFSTRNSQARALQLAQVQVTEVSTTPFAATGT